MSEDVVPLHDGRINPVVICSTCDGVPGEHGSFPTIACRSTIVVFHATRYLLSVH